MQYISTKLALFMSISSLILLNAIQGVDKVIAINLTNMPVAVTLVRAVRTLTSSRHTNLYTTPDDQPENELQIHIIPPGQETQLRNYPTELTTYDRDVLASQSINDLARALQRKKTAGSTISYYNVGGTTSTIYVLPVSAGKIKVTAAVTKQQKETRAILQDLSKGFIVSTYTLDELINPQIAQAEMATQKAQLAKGISAAQNAVPKPEEATTLPQKNTVPAAPKVPVRASPALSVKALTKELTSLTTYDNFKKWLGTHTVGLKLVAQKFSQTENNFQETDTPQERAKKVESWNNILTEYIKVISKLLQDSTNEMKKKFTEILEPCVMAQRQCILRVTTVFTKPFLPACIQTIRLLPLYIGLDIPNITLENLNIQVAPYETNRFHLMQLQTAIDNNLLKAMVQIWQEKWDFLVKKCKDFLRQSQENMAFVGELINTARPAWNTAFDNARLALPQALYDEMLFAKADTTIHESLLQIQHALYVTANPPPRALRDDPQWKEACDNTNMQIPQTNITINGVEIIEDKFISFSTALKLLGLTPEEIKAVTAARSQKTNREAALTTIGKAFKTASRQYHPDKVGNRDSQDIITAANQALRNLFEVVLPG